MRLTLGADRVGTPGNFDVLVGDSFAEGNVDLDDLLADDDQCLISARSSAGEGG